MKKMMIAACVVALAAMSQAASFDWKSAMSGGVLYNGNATDKYEGKAYLFNTTDFTQQAILSAWDSGTFSTEKALASKSIAAGKVAADSKNPFSWGEVGDTLTAFVVVDAGDRIFISGTASQGADASATRTLQYALTAGSQVDPIEFEKGAAKFSAQGWYKSTGGGVPEPTSGVLLLIGMAGLALRRKQK